MAPIKGKVQSRKEKSATSPKAKHDPNWPYKKIFLIPTLEPMAGASITPTISATPTRIEPITDPLSVSTVEKITFE